MDIVNVGIMRKIKVPLPLKLQNQFAERVQAIETQKAQAQASFAQAEDLFNSLYKGHLKESWCEFDFPILTNNSLVTYRIYFFLE